MSTGTVSASARPAVGKRAGKYLSFHLDDEEYAIEVLRVREIVRIQHITPVPEMPAEVRGVINLRGRVIPVFDLRLKFGMSKIDYGQRTCIIVIEPREAAHGPMGIIVDDVSEVLTLSEKDIQDTPDFGSGVQTPCLLGLARVRDEVKILLDIDELLATADLNSLRRTIA